MNTPSFKEDHISQIVALQLLQTANKEIQLLKTEKLREKKKGLMQVLLTGKKRLKYA
jgi:type I restriction enzyme S subunit